LGRGISLAARTVWRWLYTERSKPWRYHLWQRPSTPHFVALATPVLQLYEPATTLLKQGI
jgi:hypothetical protein